MKNKKAIGVAVASALALALCGGALVGCGDDPKPKKLTDKALEATKIADFTTGEAADRKAVFATNGFENGDVFNTWWNSENVSYDNGMAELSISAMSEKEQKWNSEYDAEEAESNPDYDVPQYIDCQANYYGGEMRSSEYYGYGDYEVCMKPSNVVGTASTFFVCTGPYDVNYETKVPNKHDEVDIEFLGKDTTKVQFNYFVNGVGGHEYMYNLGFDASKDFHTYGFRWTSEYIVWFVDGKPVYKVNAGKNKAMPSTAGRILTNYWTGTEEAEDWMGKLPSDYSTKAQYKYIATSATAQPDPTKKPEEPPVELDVPEEGWTDIDYSGFDGWGTYTVNKENGLNISHTQKVGAYNPCGMELASNYSWVKFNIKNNSETDEAVVRFDVNKADTANGIVGVVSEHNGVSYISDPGAALIKLAAGESADVACKISDKVTVNQILVFLNNVNEATATAGDITITELKGIEAEAGEDPGPEDPSTKDSKVDAEVLIGESKISFEGTGYIGSVSEDNKALTLSYENIVGDSYKNITGDVSDIIGDNNVFTVTIKNDGTETAKVRLDIICPKNAVHTGGTFCNLKAEYDGEIVEKGNDYPYGGADWVKIAAGNTITAKITFKTGVDASAVTFFVDSSTYQDSEKHTGSIVFSNMSFSKEEVVEAKPELPEGEGWTAIVFPTTAGGYKDGAYSSTTSANSITITHSTAPESDSNVNTPSVVYGENNFVHLEIKNNHETNTARVALITQNGDPTWANVIKVASITVTGDGCTKDGNIVVVEAGKTAVVEFYVNAGAMNLCFGVNNTGATEGNITISKVAMKQQTYVAPPVDDAVLPEGEGWTAIALLATMNVNNDKNHVYEYTTNANSIHITHDAKPVSDGDRPSISMDYDYNGNTLVHMKIKNNLDSVAKMCINVQQSTWDFRTVIQSATIDGENYEVPALGDNWNGIEFELEANQEITLEIVIASAATNICFAPNNMNDGAETGDITITELAMKTPDAE